MRVVHFLRKPSLANYSVERMFEDVRSVPTPDIQFEVRVNAHASKGVLPRLRDLLAARRHQGDVNHVTGDVHYVACLLAGRRTVITVLDCLTLDRLQGWRRSLFWLLWYWLPFKRVHHVTVISEFTQRQLLQHVDIARERIQVVYPALSEEFQPAPKALNLQRPRILHIGTTPNKNLRRVVEALTGIPCQLVIVGVLPAGMQETLNESGVAWENASDLSRAELLDQYRRADLVMFASTYEGFGLPIIEANAVGRPVITSNLGPMPEVAGDAACLVDPHDVASIRDAVLRLSSDPAYAERLVRAGLVNAERFRLARIAGQYQDLYRRIATAAQAE